MQDFKQGEDVLVWDGDDSIDAGQAKPAKFIIFHGGCFWCEGTDPDELVPFNQAKPIPKPELIPFAFDTFPRGSVWTTPLKNKADPGRYLITGQTSFGVHFAGSHITYDHLLADCQISTDNCETWRPAGQEVTE